jgi:hypothetical protein
MTVTGLWGLIDTEGHGVKQTSLCASEGELGRIYNELDGIVLAVDVGLLLVRAMTRPSARDDGMDERGAAKKAVFEKCVPVFSKRVHIG